MINPLVVTTIEYGGMLSIMCIGLTVTYQTTKVPNFAFADYAVAGMFASYFAFVLLNLSSPYFAIPVAFLAGGAFSVVMYLVVMKPMIRRGTSIIILMVASLAVDIFFTGVAADIVNIGVVPFANAFLHHGFPSLVYAAPLPDFAVPGICASPQTCGLLITSPVALIVTTALMFVLLTRTKFGIAMRASIENPSLARIAGINVDRVYLVSWFIAGGLGGLAGCLYAIGSGYSLNIENVLILDIFAGSVLGGLSSIYGAVIGGMLVSFGENYIVPQLAINVNSQLGVLEVGGSSMIILIITLLVAPRGLVAVNWKKLVPWRR
jgi:branched-chain amino acid transport system permease protein